MVRNVAIVAFSISLVAAAGLANNEAPGGNASPARNAVPAVRESRPGTRLMVTSRTARLQVGRETIVTLTKGMTITVVEVTGDWVGGRVTIDGTTHTGWVLVGDLGLVRAGDTTPPASSSAKTPLGGSSKPKDVAKTESTKNAVSDSPIGPLTRALPPARESPPTKNQSGNDVSREQRPAPTDTNQGKAVSPAPARGAKTARPLESKTETEAPKTSPGEPAKAPPARSADDQTRESTASKPGADTANPARPRIAPTPQPQPRQESQTKSGANPSPPRQNETSAELHGVDVQFLLVQFIAQLEQADPTVRIGQLTLVGDRLTDRSLKYLNRLSVRKLSIEATSVTNSGLKYFSQIRDLRFLRLWSPRFRDGALRHLAALHDLESLDLEGSSIVGDHLDQLANLPKLSALALGPLTTDSTLDKLVELRALEQLDLRACGRLTEASYERLARLRNLKRLWLPTHIARKGRAYLRGRLPDCQMW